MQRLDFQLPDFVRRAWVSPASRAVWEPRIQRIQEAWRILERESVVLGVRSSGIVTLTPAELVAVAGSLAKKGVFVLPLSRVLETPGVYQSAVLPPRDDRDYGLRTAVGSAHALSAFQEAWETDDDESIGVLLGYPPCCRAFFRRTWREHRLRDPTWAMAGGSMDAEDSRRCIELRGFAEANLLARFIGVRCVPHLPCSFTCLPSVDAGRTFLSLGRDLGFTDEMAWLEEILCWSYEWSALHGIAEIRSPILKVAVATDATADTHVVRLNGGTAPKEAQRGKRFPYSQHSLSAGV